MDTKLHYVINCFEIYFKSCMNYLILLCRYNLFSQGVLGILDFNKNGIKILENIKIVSSKLSVKLKHLHTIPG